VSSKLPAAKLAIDVPVRTALYAGGLVNLIFGNYSVHLKKT